MQMRCDLRLPLAAHIYELLSGMVPFDTFNYKLIN